MANERIISITHFVNPHNFWYTNVNSTAENLHQREHIENALAKLKGSNSLRLYNQRYTWQQCEKVAVFFVSWNRIIRGKYLKQLDYLGKQEEHLIWAIDYGFPFSTSSKFLLQLPAELADDMGNVHWGGIANIFPAKLEFDFNKRKAVPMRIEKWSEQSGKLLEDALTDAAHIAFMFKANSALTHHWGDLKIVNHRGDTFYASEMLVETFNAVDAENDYEFGDFVRSENSQHIVTLICNNLNGIKTNDINYVAMNRVQKISLLVPPSPAQCDEHTLNKIDNWKTFDNQSVLSPKSKSSPRTKQLTDECSVSDIELGESASNFVGNEPSEAEAEEYQMDPIKYKTIYTHLSEDAIFAMEKDMPFDYFEQNPVSKAASVSTECDAKSLRAEKLRQLRRKQKDAQKIETESSCVSTKTSNNTLLDNKEDSFESRDRANERNRNPYGLSSNQELEFDEDLLKQLSMVTEKTNRHFRDGYRMDTQKETKTHITNNQPVNSIQTTHK